MKLKIIFLIIAALVLHGLSNAQESILNIKVIDNETKAPVEYALVLIYGSKTFDGGYCNNKGEINIKFNETPDSIEIRCVGYKSEKIFKPSILDKINIFLEPSVTTINPVVIKPGKKATLGWIKFVSEYFVINDFKEFATLVPNNQQQKGVINKIFFIAKQFESQCPCKVKVQLYEVNDIRTPCKELLPKTILVDIDKKGRTKYEVDISKYGLSFPENGVFVGLESICNTGSNTNENKNCAIMFGINQMKDPKDASLDRGYKWIKNSNTIDPNNTDKTIFGQNDWKIQRTSNTHDYSQMQVSLEIVLNNQNDK